MTITINGRSYDLEIDPMGDRFHPDLPNYVLTGARGARYVSMRNQKTPHMMFLVSDAGSVHTHGLRNVWLSDKTGELRQVR